MISYSTDPQSLVSLGGSGQTAYVGAVPFPHAVIDGFFDPQVLDVVLAEVNGVDKNRRSGKFTHRKTDHNKFTFMPDVVGLETARLVNYLNSGMFISYIENLTGIAGLLADPSYFGGGVHWIDNGGFLEVHADFNHLKKYNLERRLNLLLYLNKDWEDGYHGELELWDRETMKMVKVVSPIFNRCVIFSTTMNSLHGHPEPLNVPVGVARRSIALYYYTNTWNPVGQAHTTMYYISRNNKVKFKVGRIIRGVLRDLVPPIFRKVFRAIKRAIKGEKLTELWD